MLNLRYRFDDQGFPVNTSANLRRITPTREFIANPNLAALTFLAVAAANGQADCAINPDHIPADSATATRKRPSAR